MQVLVKRVYDAPEGADGYRVLVDRVWPRGRTKEQVAAAEWLKDVGPSTGLRRWFGHDPERFEEFAARYRAELDGNPAVEQLRRIVAAQPTVTLVYGAKDEQHNQAVVLREYLTA